MDSLLANTSTTSGETLEDYDDHEDVFHPQKEDVIFACALDGWRSGYSDEEDDVLERLEEPTIEDGNGTIKKKGKKKKKEKRRRRRRGSGKRKKLK